MRLTEGQYVKLKHTADPLMAQSSALPCLAERG